MKTKIIAKVQRWGIAEWYGYALESCDTAKRWTVLTQEESRQMLLDAKPINITEFLANLKGKLV